MTQRMPILILDQDRNVRETIESIIRQYGDHLQICASTDDLYEGLRCAPPQGHLLAILGVEHLGRGVEQVQAIRARSPQSSLFVTAYEKNPDWILRLMRAGAEEYLLKPLEQKELMDALQRIENRWHPPAPASSASRGKIISVFNPVGGQGTTTVAVNLAAALAKEKEKGKVALVDLTLFSGDVAIFLDQTPNYTLSSVTSNLSRMDRNFLMSVMPRHSSGVHLLAAPLDMEETLQITAEQIQKVLDILQTVFSHVVIDTGGHIYGANEVIFWQSDQIIFNTVLTLPALENAKRYLAAMERQGLSREKIKIVVNRYIPRSDIKVEDAQKILGREVFFTIPNNYKDAITSINKGIPLVHLFPRSLASKAIMNLAEML